MQHEKILILDFGSSLTQRIARQVRAAQVYCEIHPADVSNEWLHHQISHEQVKGVILSGGYADMAPDSNPAPSAVFDLGVPVLGICYGMRAMARQLGGQVTESPERGFDVHTVRARGHTRLLKGIEDFQTPEGQGMLHAWMHTGSQVSQLPPGFKLMASCDHCAISGMADEARRFYGLHFHPEVPQTPQGNEIMARFVRDVCDAGTHWTMDNHVAEAVDAIRQRVGNERVLLGLSGGVDSSVTAALIHRAIGDQLTCVFVDHGLLRLNEAQSVMDMVAGQLHVNVVHVDASEQFLQKLQGVNDPEQKRKIIGHEFIGVFKAEAAKLIAHGAGAGAGAGGQGIRFLAQGTIYPDVIESGGGKKNATIKSHHNVGGLPEQLGLELLEPLRDLFKDEVRELGLALGLSPEMVFRHPFPGPGLGVRILGEVKKDYADTLRRADAIFIEELRNTIDQASGKNWYQLTSQAFAVFLPVKSVGAVNGQRTYEHAVALRAVQTTDFMRAEPAELPHAMLRKISARIIHEVSGINRVTYDISSKPPATIEWE